MPDRELARSLELLREEVAALGEDRSASRERLEGLIADLEHRIADPVDLAAHAGLADDVAAAILHFDVDNPLTTASLHHTSVLLGRTGTLPPLPRRGRPPRSLRPRTSTGASLPLSTASSSETG